jgi:hypothetical protein
VGLHVVAAILERLAREGLVDRLDLLQERHVGLRLVQPVAERLDPRLHDPLMLNVAAAAIRMRLVLARGFVDLRQPREGAVGNFRRNGQCQGHRGSVLAPERSIFL